MFPRDREIYGVEACVCVCVCVCESERNKGKQRRGKIQEVLMRLSPFRGLNVVSPSPFAATN